MAEFAPALTHLGVYTDHPTAMRDFYVGALGMVVSDAGHGMLFKREIIFMTGDPAQHHQFVLVVREPGDPPGGALFQISFKVKSLDELRAAVARAVARGATEVNGMNHGNSWSVYFRDPDRNMVEVYLDTGWYVPQPFADPLLLEQSDEQIRDYTAERIRGLAGALPQGEWSAQIAERIDHNREG